MCLFLYSRYTHYKHTFVVTCHIITVNADIHLLIKLYHMIKFYIRYCRGRITTYQLHFLLFFGSKAGSYWIGRFLAFSNGTHSRFCIASLTSLLSEAIRILYLTALIGLCITSLISDTVRSSLYRVINVKIYDWLQSCLIFIIILPTIFLYFNFLR